MPPTADPGIAARLHAALAALPLVIEDVGCKRDAVVVPSYGGERPTSLVRLRGRSARGYGENVAWTDVAHAAFARHARAVPRGRWTLADWGDAMRGVIPDAYGRAAVEAAAIDLALRQQRTSLCALAGIEPRPVRYVVSFGRTTDPVAEAARHPDVGLKIDVDPGWDEDVYSGLATIGRVAVLDFKGSGSRDVHERAHRILPDALLEDPSAAAAPWSDTLVARLSFDAPLTAAAELDALVVRPAFVNLKPGRMGGVLETLACAARCAEAGIGVYVGGMFEIAVGRAQLRDLAAVLCPEGPNDIAPIAVDDAAPARPAHLGVDTAAVGFGNAA